MKKFTLRALLVGFLTAGFSCPPSFALKVTPEYKKALLNRTAGLTSKGVNKRLLRAMKYMARNEKSNAIGALEKMTKNSYRPFERAKIWQNLAYAYAQSEMYKRAQKAFQKVLEIDALPYRPTLQTLFALAQLQVVAENYNQAEKTLKDWFFLTDSPTPESYIFKATIDYNKNKLDKALAGVTKAIGMVQNPKENWLVFAVSLLYTKEKYKKAAEYLTMLVEKNHLKKIYWTQLAGSLLSQNKGLLALASLKLALMMDLLTEESEILNIASLYLSHELPYEGAQILEMALKKKKIKESAKNYEILANALIGAKEYDAALEPLEIAAKKSKNGKLYALKARLYLEKEKFKKSLKYFDMAISKGLKKENLGRILIEKAVAYIQLKDYKLALLTLDKASKFKNAQEMANTWRSYIQSL